MSIKPGIFSANLIGKQAGAPATTPANQASGYTFSTGNTTIGSVAVVKKTATVTDGAPWVAPSYSSDTLSFDGTQSIAYLVNSNLHVSYGGSTNAPTNMYDYSVQLDFNSTYQTRVQHLLNCGEGYGIGWPEYNIVLENDGTSMFVRTYTTSNNDSTGLARYDYAYVNPGQWYRVGLMFYNSGGANYIRGYLNGEIKFDKILNQVANSSGFKNVTNPAVSVKRPFISTANGIAIGNDNANFKGNAGYPYSRFFVGQMRNIFIGRDTKFWPI